MLVIAFDGLLFDTLEFRATAVVNALAAEGIEMQQQAVLSLLPSRSLAEAVRAAAQSHAVRTRSAQAAHVQTAPAQAAQAQTMPPQLVDETSIDLAVLRAERTVREWGSRGATLNVAVRDQLRRAAAVTRIVIRADSGRHTVEQLLALADIDGAVAFTLCCDDVAGTNSARHSNSARNTNSASNPHTSEVGEGTLTREREPALTSIERSYEQIVRRMYANQTLLGNAGCIGLALELGDAGRAAARKHGFDTPETFDVAHFPGL